jgi:hypothetical protein
MARNKRTVQKEVVKKPYMETDSGPEAEPDVEWFPPSRKRKAAPKASGGKAAPKKKALAPAETHKPCTLANMPSVFKGVHESLTARFRGRKWHEMVMEQQGLGRSGLFTTKSQYRIFESYVLWAMVYASHAALPEEDCSSSDSE